MYLEHAVPQGVMASQPSYLKVAGCPSRRSLPLIQPALRIFFVVERNSLLSELERMLCVEHHGQLFCSRSVLARHDRTGMRPVRNPSRMQRY